MGTFASLATAPLRWGLLLLSALVPRDRRLWVFGSSFGRRFADNAKWLFLHCVQHQEALGIRPIWVTRHARVRDDLADQGFDVRLFAWWNLRALWTTMRAGVWIYDSDLWDIGYVTSARARKVNLWHGIPLKRVKLAIGNVNHPDRVARHASWPRRLLERTLRPGAGVVHDLVPATSPVCRDRFVEAFELPPDRVPILGYPRNDALLAEEVPPAAVSHPIHREAADRRQGGARVILYMPTFRDTRPAGQDHAVDWGLLDEAAATHDLLFVVKLHPRDQARPADPAQYPHLRFLPADLDPYPLLRSVDVLVTDYSSVYLDFLLLDRPVFFFAYDLDEYLKADRPLHEDYDEATPGPKVRTTSELVGAVAAWAADPDTHEVRWRRRRAVVRKRFHSHEDAESARRVTDEIRTRFA